MIRRSTIFLLVVLLLLVGLVFYLRNREAGVETAATPTEAMVALFDTSLGEPSMIRVENEIGEKVEFKRDSTGQWVLSAPEAAAADQASAEAAATQVGDLKVLSTVDLTPDVIGLDKPAYIVTLGFGASGTHVLRIGDVTPVQDGYYAQLDAGPYQVVDKYGLDILIELIASPPYLATPTPEFTMTPLASPTLPVESTATGSPVDLATGTPQGMTEPTATP